MSTFLLGLGLIMVSGAIGFLAGVWATHSWVEKISPGTSRQLLDLDTRQRRNQK